jgi:hypothetical protein
MDSQLRNPAVALVTRTFQLLSAALLCSLLTGCFFLPGKFTSHLDIRRDGSYSFSYIGELVFVFPEEAGTGWTDTMARCVDDTAPRPCAADEVQAHRVHFEAGAIARKAQAAEFAAIFGYDPYDRAANEEIARRMTEYRGWNKVAYIGDGVFAVEYQISGIIDQDLVFPVLPHAQIAMPFINIRRTKGSSVEIAAPALATQQLRSALLGMTGIQDDADLPMMKRADGTFILTTDAELSDSNGKMKKHLSEHSIEWRIDGTTETLPKAQLVLDVSEPLKESK